MRKFFTKMSPKTLAKIMQECHQTTLDGLLEWCKDHSIKRIDIIARYPELRDDKGLM